ncbi:hypothetical protein K474DRAFT_1658192 [Panus rudis PR-1116 ss-1]|nr:hypothetical protein K474DRAFT_1658192 [Panus rudis PR-1116 ss-1]
MLSTLDLLILLIFFIIIYSLTLYIYFCIINHFAQVIQTYIDFKDNSGWGNNNSWGNNNTSDWN